MRKVLPPLLLAASNLLGSFDFEETSLQLDTALMPPSKSTSLESSDFFFSFDFLYWEGIEEGLEYAQKNTKKGDMYEPAFGFNPAFRVGIGTHLSQENWDVEFLYTRYASASKTHSNQDVLPIWTFRSDVQTNWSNSLSKWKLNTHLIDLYFKTPLCITSNVALEPALGLKFALLQQQYTVLYKNRIEESGPPFIESKLAMKNRSFNLGMGAKLSTTWCISDHFDLIGKIAGSLLATRFDIGQNAFNLSISEIDGLHVESTRENGDFWTLRPTASMLIGFGWSSFLCRPKSVIRYGLNASYEGTCFWNENMLFRFMEPSHRATLKTREGNLVLHGLTIEGFIDF